MAVNKVIFGNRTLMDLTGDTVTADKLLDGITAHNKSGTVITGTMSPINVTVSNASVSKISGTADDYLMTMQ